MCIVFTAKGCGECTAFIAAVKLSLKKNLQQNNLILKYAFYYNQIAFEKGRQQQIAEIIRQKIYQHQM